MSKRTLLPASLQLSDLCIGLISASGGSALDVDDHAKLAFVGRFSPEKGIEDFLNVVEMLADRLAVRVAIAGGESSDPSLNAWQTSHPGLGRTVFLTDLKFGATDGRGRTRLSRRTTGTVKEQFGKAPLEAMAVGTPVFAYNCGALKEVVRDGGIVVDEGARMTLVDELERYFRSSPETQRQLTDQALVSASRFTDAALADGLLRIWSEVLATQTDPEETRPMDTYVAHN